MISRITSRLTDGMAMMISSILYLAANIGISSRLPKILKPFIRRLCLNISSSTKPMIRRERL